MCIMTKHQYRAVYNIVKGCSIKCLIFLINHNNDIDNFINFMNSSIPMWNESKIQKKRNSQQQ
jgi:hypothetical protein